MPTYYHPVTGNPEVHATQPRDYLTTPPSNPRTTTPQFKKSTLGPLEEFNIVRVATEQIRPGDIWFLYSTSSGQWYAYESVSLIAVGGQFTWGAFEQFSSVPYTETEMDFWCKRHPIHSDDILPPTGNYWCGYKNALSEYDDHERHTEIIGGNPQVMGGAVSTPPLVTEIHVSTPPSKTIYTEGDSVNTSGMVIEATYSDGTVEVVTGWVVSPTGALTTSNTILTISYTENGVTRTVTQPITVNPVPVTLTSISVYTAPTKKNYESGEYFSTSGMVIRAYYNNNTSKNVTGYSYSPGGALSTSHSNVTITYSEGGITKTTSYSITVTAPLSNSQLVTNAWGSLQEYSRTTNGSFVIPATGTYEICMVSGGAGGGFGTASSNSSSALGRSFGGGGGIPGVIIGQEYLTKGTSITVQIGTGGSGATTNGVGGTAGGPTFISSLGMYANGPGGGGAGATMTVMSADKMQPCGGAGGGGMGYGTRMNATSGGASGQFNGGNGGAGGGGYTGGSAGTVANPEATGVPLTESGLITGEYYRRHVTAAGDTDGGIVIIRNLSNVTKCTIKSGNGGKLGTSASSGGKGWMGIKFIY